MHQHTRFAKDMLEGISFLQPALDVVYNHHERWHGSGYPDGLKGEEIPLAAHIFAVVDNWDALSSDRPYRKAWPVEKIIDYIRQNAGVMFDPHIVEVFLKMEKI
jgi:HD-GYP domain-containing protein (c-di-GMP phosphodiesterase class II)